MTEQIRRSWQHMSGAQRAFASLLMVAVCAGFAVALATAQGRAVSGQTQTDTDHDGFADSFDSNAVSRMYVPWGDPRYTQGDFTAYPWQPAWGLAAYRVGGDWSTSPACWYVVNSGQQ